VQVMNQKKRDFNMQLTEQQKNLLTKIKSELIQQDVDSSLVDPMSMVEMAKALDDSNKTIANYLQEEN